MGVGGMRMVWMVVVWMVRVVVVRAVGMMRMVTVEEECTAMLSSRPFFCGGRSGGRSNGHSDHEELGDL